MILKEVKGNLFNELTFDIMNGDVNVAMVAHGCNTQGVMGAGFAKQVKDRWPWAFQGYRSQLKHFSPGMFIPVCNETRETFVFNLLTQEKTGPAAKTAYIEQCLASLEYYLENLKLIDQPVYIPRIGTGIGGLDWESEVKPIFENSKIKFNVYFI